MFLNSSVFENKYLVSMKILLKILWWSCSCSASVLWTNHIQRHIITVLFTHHALCCVMMTGGHSSNLISITTEFLLMIQCMVCFWCVLYWQDVTSMTGGGAKHSGESGCSSRAPGTRPPEQRWSSGAPPPDETPRCNTDTEWWCQRGHAHIMMPFHKATPTKQVIKEIFFIWLFLLDFFFF